MLLDGRLDAGALEHGFGMEGGEEALRDEVVDARLVRAHLREIVLGLRRDDRVVVLDARVVDHPAERQLVQAGDIGGRFRVLRVSPDHVGRRLDLADHVAGQVARARARVCDRLVLLVELLGRAEGSAGGEAEENVRVALQRGEVVQELGSLPLLLLLELRDQAGAPAALLDDLRRLLFRNALAPEVAAAVDALAGRFEARLDEPVRLGRESSDLQFPSDDERERRRLHAPEGDGAVEGGA